MSTIDGLINEAREIFIETVIADDLEIYKVPLVRKKMSRDQTMD